MGFAFRSIFGNTYNETVPGIENKFRNTVLWDYLPLVYSFFADEVHHRWEEAIFKDTRSGVQRYIDETLQLARLLLSLKEGHFRGKGWIIDSSADALKIYDSVESIFLEKLDELPDVVHRYEWEEYSSEVIDDWDKALSAFPRSNSFEKEELEVHEDVNELTDCRRRLSINEIEAATRSIKNCQKIANKFYIRSDEAVAKRFVAYMIENNVPESRAMYRCWYDALDCFEGISDEIKVSHRTHRADNDPEGNYIKAIASRIHDRISQQP